MKTTLKGQCHKEATDWKANVCRKYLHIYKHTHHIESNHNVYAQTKYRKCHNFTASKKLFKIWQSPEIWTALSKFNSSTVKKNRAKIKC